MKTSPLALPLLACLVLAAPAFAQQPARPEVGAASYAVNSAAISAGMTYCMTKFGPLTTGSRSAACFSRARNLIAGFGLREKSAQIEQACQDPAGFNTCITPEIGRLVMSLHAAFEAGDL